MKGKDSLFQQVLADAQAKGKAAAVAARASVVPMVVSEADGLSDRPKPGGKSWFIADGVCGFAWVRFPKLPGNEFAQWLKKTGQGHKGYPTGWELSVHDYNQSMQLKEVHANAMAAHLRAYGVDCYAQSRID